MATTAQQAFEHAQRATMPREDLSQYEGSWVALREGRVVAAAPDAGTLHENPVVGENDVLMAVPRDHDSLLIA